MIKKIASGNSVTEVVKCGKACYDCVSDEVCEIITQ